MILLQYKWEIIVVLLALLLVIGLLLIARMRRDIDLMATSNMPREGLPQHIEAAWEDIGDRGRFLTDLGGMSVGMKEEMYAEFVKALNKPIKTIPAAGSVNDILLDLDRRLTEIEEMKSDTEGN